MGVHGAALTNAVFAPSRVCVVELSSWVDKEQRKPWRWGERTVPMWSPAIDWRVHRLPPAQIVASMSHADRRRFWIDAPDPTLRDANGGVPPTPSHKRDLMLQRAPTFHVHPSDLDGVALQLRECVQRPQVRTAYGVF